MERKKINVRRIRVKINRAAARTINCVISLVRSTAGLRFVIIFAVVVEFYGILFFSWFWIFLFIFFEDSLERAPFDPRRWLNCNVDPV